LAPIFLSPGSWSVTLKSKLKCLNNLIGGGRLFIQPLIDFLLKKKLIPNFFSAEFLFAAKVVNFSSGGDLCQAVIRGY